MRKARQSDFLSFRKQFPVFTFNSFSIDEIPGGYTFQYHFSLSDEIGFKPALTFRLPEAFGPAASGFDRDVLEAFAFHIGMIELISYWKTACPPKVVIRPRMLTPDMINWWKKLYFNGLGEFFYLNQIETSPDDFMHIEATGTTAPALVHPLVNDRRVLVPVGGGKDSVVTLELMKKGGYEVVPFIVNPRGASLNCVIRAGFSEKKLFRVERTLDATMLKLNEQGFLNGHTPFSALLAFVSLPAATLCGAQHIALSNESSANESTVPGSLINHQYSKTIDFENDFRYYLEKYITRKLNYFSFLRPLNELQIASLFSRFTHHHNVFRSCNAGSKTDSWCGKCPKCLFTAVILAPFIGVDRVHSLLNHPVLDDLSLAPVLDELAGISEVKPFECVGTVDEVVAALQKIASNNENPLLVGQFLKKTGLPADSSGFNKQLSAVNHQHNLTGNFFSLFND